jgi:hypothetical protein
MDIINKEHSEKMKLGKMSKETNSKKFFTPPKSPQESDVNRHTRNSENNKTTLSMKAFERNRRTNRTICK